MCIAGTRGGHFLYRFVRRRDAKSARNPRPLLSSLLST